MTPADLNFELLLAQREAAYWTAWAAGAAVLGLIGLPVNGIGIWLVWRQLKLNESALKDASRSADAAATAAEASMLATRPWIRLKVDSEKSTISNISGSHVLSLHISYENIGKTPATRLWILEKAVADDELDLVSHFEESHQQFVDAGSSLFPEEGDEGIWTISLPPHPNEKVGWVVGIAAMYFIPGSQAPRMSALIYNVKKGSGFGPGDRLYPDMARQWNVALTLDLRR